MSVLVFYYLVNMRAGVHRLCHLSEFPCPHVLDINANKVNGESPGDAGVGDQASMAPGEGCQRHRACTRRLLLSHQEEPWPPAPESVGTPDSLSLCFQCCMTSGLTLNLNSPLLSPKEQGYSTGRRLADMRD